MKPKSDQKREVERLPRGSVDPRLGGAGNDRTDPSVTDELDFLHKIVDGLPGTFYILNKHQRLIRWNKHLEEISEFSPEEIRSAHPLDFIAEDQRELVAERINEVFTSGSAEIEADLQTRSGRRIPHYFNGVLIEIDGESHVMGMGLNITKRHLAEQRLALVLKAGRLGTWMWDMEANISVFNQQEFELLGMEPSNTPVKTDVFFKRVHPDDRKELRRKVKAAIKRKGYFEHEFRIVRPDGKICWIAGRGEVVLGGGEEKHTQMFGVNYDISEHKRYEEELEKTNYLLETVLNSIPQGVFWKDRNSIYMGSNDLVAEMAGFSNASDIVGKSDYQLPNVPSEQAELYIEKDREVMESGIPQSGIEYISNHPDGRQIWLETSKVPLRDTAGEIVGVLGTWTDITEKRRLEEQLRQSQKMEAFGQLAAGVAHDFNNLLTVITGYSDILLMNLADDDPRRSAVLSIGDAADRAAALTRQLLAFSRLTVLDPRVTGLNTIVDEMDQILRRLTGENIIFEKRLTKDLWPVKVDQSQIGQVLLNLVINARDAMPEGGTLTIETRNIDLSDVDAAKLADVEPGNYVMLAVSDTGTGIPESDLNRIFEPFFTTKGAGKGTGLGLAVVHGIIKQSGGSILVESEKGKGSVFKVYLPAVTEVDTSVIKHKTAVGSNNGNETILLVEDEAAVRSYAKYALEQCGYHVIEAASGAEALEIANDRGGEIDLLLTDMVMPGIDGRRLAEELTARFEHVKVMFVSGYTGDAAIRQRILKEHMAFLQKPYSPSALAAKVREVLDEGSSKS